MEKRTFVALILYFLVFFIWYQWWSSKKQVQHQSQHQIQQTPTLQTQSQPNIPNIKDSGKEIYVETDLYKATFTTFGAKIKNFRLKKYFKDHKEELQLISNNIQNLSFGIIGCAENDTWNYLIVDYKINTEDKILLDETNKEKTIEFETITPQGIKIIKRLKFCYNSYLISTEIEFKNINSTDIIIGKEGGYKFVFGPGIYGDNSVKDQMSLESVVFINNKSVRKKVLNPQQIKEYNGFPKWVALKSKYFAGCLIPKDKIESCFIQNFAEKQEAKQILFQKELIGVKMPLIYLKPGEIIKHNFFVFIGPLDYKLLSSLTDNKGENLELNKIIYLGYELFRGLSVLMLVFLKWLYFVTKNYGLAIILLTIITRILLLPITQMSVKSMTQMQKLQPHFQSLKEQYKNDQHRLSKETMELYKKYKVNPFSGCLPSLLQMPFFISLWGALNYAIELRQSKFLWINDLSMPDTLFVFGNFNFNFLPILMGLTTFWQQKITPSVGGQTSQTKMMLYFMPIFLTLIFWNFPSGLVLYWFLTNVLTIIQQKLITK